MAEAIQDGVTTGVRRLARLFEPFHSVTYYSPEILRLHDEGYRGWWHSYFGYRPAPMGPVPAKVVVAAFYNFAPRMVERAVPGVWDIHSPADSIQRRLELVDEALRRAFAHDLAGRHMTGAAELARRAIEGCDVAGRALYGGYAELAWPDEPYLALWHACTLMREHRGDSHNIALAAVDLDGVECHVMMAAHGHGNRPTIAAIRGWTDEEWDAAVERLGVRGLVTGDGEYTEAGRRARSDVERHTDELASEPARRLGPDGVAALVGHLEPLVEHLTTTGEVSGRWPPPHLIQPRPTR